MIAGSKTKIKRIGKFHYKIEVELDLTQKQVNVMFRGNDDSNTQKLRR